MTNNEILGKHGWTIVCDSPFTIENEDGSSAIGLAAYIVLGEYSRQENKEKTVLEKDLKVWDVYEAPTGNKFIKISKNHAVAIGSSKTCKPEIGLISSANYSTHEKLFLPCVENISETFEVKKIGRIKFKK